MNSTTATIPPDYLQQPTHIPAFWRATCAEVNTFLDEQITKGTVEQTGTSAGGRPIRAVTYGTPRRGKGTTTFSGSQGYGTVANYLGPDADRKVYLAMAGVHGGEFEGIVGCVNLLSVLETGGDLAGNAWPELSAAADAVDRLIVLPILNPDGRDRVPMRALTYRDDDYSVFQFFNTGAWTDGEQIGWPSCKEFIPLDFTQTSYPGGYPNDNGVNVMHDDFFGSPQPETRAILDLAARERPDLVLDMHTGAPLQNYHTCIIGGAPYDPALLHAWHDLYRRVHTGLTEAGLRATDDVAAESDPGHVRVPGTFNLSAALGLHCGTLTATTESPCPGYAGRSPNGDLAPHSFEDVLKAQLICHQEALAHLAETGGRRKWAP